MIFLALLLLIGEKVSYASRVGVVDIEGTEVREGPGSKYKILEKLAKGSPVAASNLPVEGFFKVRSRSGQIGWVVADSLVLQPPPAEESVGDTSPPATPPSSAPPQADSSAVPTPAAPAAFREKKKKTQIRFRAFGGGELFNIASSLTVTNAFNEVGGWTYGGNFGGEVAFNFTNDLALVARVEYMLKYAVLTNPTSGKQFEVDITSIPSMIGMELVLFGDAHSKFSSRFGVLGGLALQTNLTSTYLGTAGGPGANDIAQVSATAFTGYAKIDLNYQFTRLFSVYGEVGFHYLRTVSLLPPSNNGSQILSSPLSLDLSGPSFCLGASVSL